MRVNSIAPGAYASEMTGGKVSVYRFDHCDLT